jgi:hypothetical protein
MLVLSVCGVIMAACGRDANVMPVAAGSASPPGTPSSSPAIVDVASASDEFNDPATLGKWTVMQGELPDGQSSIFDIGQTRPGALTILPSRSWWVDDTRGFFIYKHIQGDFVVTVRIRASGKASETPTVDWSLAGLLIRSPGGADASEQWVGYTVGFVGQPRIERKTTKASHSELRLLPVEPGWVELRVVRSGALLILMRRQSTSDWSVDAVYLRPDLAPTVQVGIDAQSGYDSDRTDLVAEMDWIHFAPTGIPPARDGVRAGPGSPALSVRDNGNALSERDTELVRDALLGYLPAG